MLGDTKEEVKPDSFCAFLSYTRSVAQTSNTIKSYNEFMKYCKVHDEPAHSIFSMVFLRKNRLKRQAGPQPESTKLASKTRIPIHKNGQVMYTCKR